MDIFVFESVTLAAGERKNVPTGLAFEVPDGYVGLIWDKGGVSMKYGIKTLGGVLDSGYRGELFIGVINLSDSAYTFEKGHKIAQMLIQKIERPEIVEITELSETTRGDGKWGSTGK